MKEYLINAEIVKGQCVYLIEASNKKEALKKAKEGDFKDVEFSEWESGEVDIDSIELKY